MLPVTKVAVAWNGPALAGAKPILTNWDPPAVTVKDLVETEKGIVVEAVTSASLPPGLESLTLRTAEEPTPTSPKSMASGETDRSAAAEPEPVTPILSVVVKEPP